MGTINKPALYAAVLQATMARIETRGVPDRFLFPKERHLFRVILPEYLPVASSVATRKIFVSRSAVQECFRVRDQATDKNRFTGCDAEGRPGPCGGVYFALQQGAGMAEMMHYGEKDVAAAVARNDFDNMLPFDVASRRISNAYLLARRGILVAQLTAPRLVADVSLHSQSSTGEVRHFLNEIGRTPEVSNLLRGQTLPDLMLDERDYSVARAIGHAIQGARRFDGMIAETARETDRHGETGSNLILFGQQDTVLKELEVQTALYFFAPGVVSQEPFMRAAVDTQL